MDALQSGPSTRPNAPIKLKRGPVACKRCRRLRSKCSHEGANPPCASCRDAGPSIAAECVFPLRGESANDREYRRKRVKKSEKEGMIKSHFSVSPSISTSNVVNKWDLLPPHAEVVEGCRVFMTSYFQLGFIPKAVFLERLARDYASVDVFLLLSILSVSARFTASLVRRYGGAVKAAEVFMARAASLVPEEMYKPTLERTQAFFLLGIAEWGNGDRDRSFMHMGVAVRMAGYLHLHREETYRLPENATADDIISAESARRTFWMIESQDNLHSGNSTPAPFSISDINALLPCEESDFAFGFIPRERAALAGTPAAAVNPALTSMPSRSLFATLIQAHNLWGRVARRACRSERDLGGASIEPWESASEYAQLAKTLYQWEEDLPDRHRWSVRNLRGYRAEALDLAYLSIVMVLRLSNIVMRRIYLTEIMSATSDTTWTGDSHRFASSAPPKFWASMSHELFSNVVGLHEQIDAYFPLRSRDEGFPAIIVFCVYICGSLASYMWKWPQLCPHLASRAEPILRRSLQVLAELQHAWPMASTWQSALSKAATMPPITSSGAPLHAVASQERFLNAADGIYREQNEGQTAPPDTEHEPAPVHDTLAQQQHPPGNEMLYNLAIAATQGIGEHAQPHGGTGARMSYVPTDVDHGHIGADQKHLVAFPTDSFEDELTAFLQGNVNFGMLEEWQRQQGL